MVGHWLYAPAFKLDAQATAHPGPPVMPLRQAQGERKVEDMTQPRTQRTSRSATSGRPALPTPHSSLDHVFHPRSAAVVGVSPQAASGGFAGMGVGFLIALKEAGFERLYPVNPKYEEVEGLRCYASILDIEGPLDHVISSVPARVVPQLVDQCITKGVKTI